MPAALRGGYQCTPIDYDDFDLWHWLDIQQVSHNVIGGTSSIFSRRH